MSSVKLSDAFVKCLSVSTSGGPSLEENDTEAAAAVDDDPPPLLLTPLMLTPPPPPPPLLLTPPPLPPNDNDALPEDDAPCPPARLNLDESSAELPPPLLPRAPPDVPAAPPDARLLGLPPEKAPTVSVELRLRPTLTTFCCPTQRAHARPTLPGRRNARGGAGAETSAPETARRGVAPHGGLGNAPTLSSLAPPVVVVFTGAIFWSALRGVSRLPICRRKKRGVQSFFLFGEPSENLLLLRCRSRGYAPKAAVMRLVACAAVYLTIARLN